MGDRRNCATWADGRGRSLYNSIWRIEHLPATRPMMLKSTTRHIHIFSAEVQDNELVPSESVLTLDIDPDNELLWSDDAVQTIYRKFDDLVEDYSGQDLTDYNLRRIGSDLEHLVRSLLLKGDLSYNLNARTLNYSMGLPKVDEEKNKFQP
jgi:NAD(P)H-quinone oxidoreductase subunit M